MRGCTTAWIGAVALGSVFFVAAFSFSGEQAELKTAKDKVNYSIGVSTIRHFRQYGTGNDMDLDMIVKGMKDELAEKPLLMSEKELRAVLTAVQTEIIQRKRTARALATMPSATPSVGPGAKP
jgi:UDP-GlcNAc:undecaprenyl-phosphate GlcNAc-1-phosphate transferase